MKESSVNFGLKASLVYVVLALFAMVVLFPLLWMTLASFKHQVEQQLWPPVWISRHPTLVNYIKLVNPSEATYFIPILPGALNTIIIALCSTGITVIIGSMAGYAFSRYKFGASGYLLILALILRILPPINVVIPLFVIFRALRLLDTYLCLIIAYMAFNLPFVIWLMTTFFNTIPKDLDEAALIDGCNRVNAFMRITLPLSVPGVVVASVFSFLFCWNEFLMALVLTQSKVKTLPLTMMLYHTDRAILWGEMSAATMVVIVPIIIFVLVIQKYLVSGLTLGGVKG